MRGRCWAVAALIACAACGGGADDAPLLTDVSVDCPRLPEGLAAQGLAIWPHPDAGDLVPDLPSLCESPVSPQLLTLLNENAFWNPSGIEAAGIGTLHRGDRAVGTFFAVRLKPDVPGLGSWVYDGSAGGRRSDAGDVELVWHSSGGHVVVEWADGRDRIAIASEDEDLAREAVARWLTAAGHDEDVSVPGEVPDAGESFPALDAGPPLAGLPDGYAAIELDPIAFRQSDFADSVTMFDQDVDALGGAIVVRGNRVVGTVVAGTGDPGVGTWPDDLLAGDRNVAGFTAGDTSVAVVGYDAKVVRAFVDEWEKRLKS